MCGSPSTPLPKLLHGQDQCDCLQYEHKHNMLKSLKYAAVYGTKFHPPRTNKSAGAELNKPDRSKVLPVKSLSREMSLLTLLSKSQGLRNTFNTAFCMLFGVIGSSKGVSDNSVVTQQDRE
jgi:hypothetical protein